MIVLSFKKPKNINKFGETTGFKWKTMEGEILDISEMATSHIFNSMKMIFNHLALMNGGNPIWFNKKYSDYAIKAKSKTEELAATVIFFMQEIDKRGDLPPKYNIPYREIVEQIIGKRMIE